MSQDLHNPTLNPESRTRFLGPFLLQAEARLQVSPRASQEPNSHGWSPGPPLSTHQLEPHHTALLTFSVPLLLTPLITQRLGEQRSCWGPQQTHPCVFRLSVWCVCPDPSATIRTEECSCPLLYYHLPDQDPTGQTVLKTLRNNGCNKKGTGTSTHVQS